MNDVKIYFRCKCARALAYMHNGQQFWHSSDKRCTKDVNRSCCLNWSVCTFNVMYTHRIHHIIIIAIIDRRIRNHATKQINEKKEVANGMFVSFIIISIIVKLYCICAELYAKDFVCVNTFNFQYFCSTIAVWYFLWYTKKKKIYHTWLRYMSQLK